MNSDGKIQYIIELLQQGDTSGAVDSLKKLDQQSKTTGDGLTKLKDAALQATAAIGSAVAIHAAVDAYVEYEKVCARLDGTLKATGNDSIAFRTELANQAKQFSATSEEGSKAIKSIQTLLISFGAGKDQVKPLTQAVLDLSAGMGIEANTAALELSKALEGIDGPLKRIGITFDANASRGEKFSSAVEQIQQRFGGLAAALKDTDAGKLNDLEKAVGGLQKQFGQLALEGLLPSIERTTELAKATKEFLGNGSLAGQYTKEIVAIVAVVGSLTAAVKGFGLAWNFVAGDAIVAAGGLKAALAAIPTSIQVVIVAAAVYQIYQAVSEALAAGTATDKAKSSASDLSASNDRIRPLVEKAINDTFSGKQKDDLLTSISSAFEPDVSYDTRGGGSVKSSARNPARESDALRQALRALNGVSPASGGNSPSAQLLADQKTGTEALSKLEEQMNAKSLEGFEQRRAEAQKLYHDQDTQIENLTRKFSLSEAQKQQAQADNEAQLVANLKKIDDAEAQKKLDDAQKLADLKAQFQTEGLTGLQKEIALEENRYQRALAHINAEKSLSPADRTDLLSLNDAAHQNARKGFDNARPSDDLKTFEEQLTQTQIGTTETRVQVAQREYLARIAYYQQLLTQGKLTEGGLTQLTQEASKQRAAILAPAVEQGMLDAERLNAREKSLFQQQVVDINKTYSTRKANLLAFYDWQLSKENLSSQQIVTINQQKQQSLDQLELQRQHATSQTYQDMVKIGDYAANSFASGISSAFVAFADGSKSAGAAFQEFAASFLEGVAQMILQLLVLQAIKNMGFALGGGGMVGSGGGAHANSYGAGSSAYAGGGMKVAAAATGIMLAAAGINGVNQVNGPTYFPKFNVLAGEAGAEMMTVLARPTSGMINGQPVVLGNVGADRLALMSQDSLARMVNSQKFAGGGMAGGGSSIAGLTPSKITSNPNGKIVVELTPHPAYEQRIISNSVEGARVAVATDLGQDSQIHRAAKQALS